MNAKDARAILETLLDGVNPVTGELLPVDHVCQEPDVLRALHKALMCLANDADAPVPSSESDAMVNRNGRLNAGRPWTQEDLDALKQLHEAGTSMDDMCRLLQRRKRGIERQLVFLGLMGGETAATDPNKKHAKAGMPWTAAEDQTLRELWQQGRPKGSIARVLQRSSWAIECRLDRLGLLNPERKEPAR